MNYGLDTEYLVPPAASFFQGLPTELSDEVTETVEDHDLGVGHHDLASCCHTNTHHVLQLHLLSQPPHYLPEEVPTLIEEHDAHTGVQHHELSLQGEDAGAQLEERRQT